MKIHIMDGVELIKDPKGRITEIRVDVKNDPDLAVNIWHLITTLKRAEDVSKSHPTKASKIFGEKGTKLSFRAFNQMIRDAKASGEISEEIFFQHNPKWRRKEKLSLQN